LVLTDDRRIMSPVRHHVPEQSLTCKNGWLVTLTTVYLTAYLPRETFAVTACCTLRDLQIADPGLDQLRCLSRTFSRLARCSAVNAPPSAYLMTPAHRTTRHLGLPRFDGQG